MAKVRLFISFDFEHDEDLRNLFVGQTKNPDTPFDIIDMSVYEPFSGNWKEKIRERIRRADQICVICGEHTDTASGVNAELSIAQEEGKTYFLLWGRSTRVCVAPRSARPTDNIYKWTWNTLRDLLNGSR